MKQVHFQKLILEIDNIKTSHYQGLFSFSTKEQKIEKLFFSTAKSMAQRYKERRNYFEYVQFFVYFLALYLEKILKYENELTLVVKNQYYSHIEKSTLFFDSSFDLTKDLYFYAITHNDEQLVQFLKKFQLSVSTNPNSFCYELENYSYATGEKLISIFKDNEDYKINNEYIINLICNNSLWINYFYSYYHNESYYDEQENNYKNRDVIHFDYSFYFDKVILDKVFNQTAQHMKLDTKELKSTYEKQKLFYETKNELPTSVNIETKEKRSTFRATRNYYREESPEKKVALKVIHYPINQKSTSASTSYNNLESNIIKKYLFSDHLIKIKPLPQAVSFVENLTLFTHDDLMISHKNFSDKKQMLIQQIKNLSYFIQEHSSTFTYHVAKLHELNKNVMLLIELFQEEYFTDDIFNTIDIINLIGFAYPSIIKSYIKILLTSETQESIDSSFAHTIDELSTLVFAFKNYVLSIIQENFKLATQEISDKFSEFEFNFRYAKEKENGLS